MGGLVDAVVDAFVAYGTFGFSLLIEGAQSLLSSLVPQIESPAGIKQGSQVYNLGARQNQTRIGGPQPVLHGKFRIYFDALSQSWTYYSGNEQYFNALLVVTLGKANPKQLYIGDTEIESFGEVTYQVYQPGQTVDLFHNNVATNEEVVDLELNPVTYLSQSKALTYSAANKTITSPDTDFTALLELDHVRVINSQFNDGDYTVFSVSTDGKVLTVVQALVDESPTVGITGTTVTSTITNQRTGFSRSSTFAYNENGQISNGDDDNSAIYGLVRNGKIGDVLIVTGGYTANGSYNIIQATPAGEPELGQPGFSTLRVNPHPANFDGTAPVIYSSVIQTDNQVGPFPACPSGTSISSFAYDITFPSGLYSVDDQGNLGASSATHSARWRVKGTDTWNILPDQVTTGSDNTPQRFTFSQVINVTGRIEVSINRTSPVSATTREQNKMNWTGLRGFIVAPTIVSPDPNKPVYVSDGHYQYPDKTVIAISARVTGQLVQALTKQINGIFQRVLPVWNGTAFVEQETSSFDAAFADLIRNPVYGGMRPDSELDLATLYTLGRAADARGDFFNGYWDQAGTLFDSLAKVARVARCTPTYNGRLFSLYRDEPKQIRTAIFTNNTCTIGDPQFAFPSPDTPQGILVKYHDPVTFQEATVLCGEDINTTTLDLFGCIDRQQAFNEGSFALADSRYRRVTQPVTPEMEGFLVERGDLVGIQNAFTKWGQSARLVAASDDLLTLQVDQALDWSAGDFTVRFRGPDAVPTDEVTCSRGNTDYEIVLANPPTIPLSTGGDQFPTVADFGTSVSRSVNALVTGFSPSGEFGGTVNCVIDDPLVHADPGPAPPVDS